MKKRFGLLALSLPAAFAVGCNLDTGIKVTWTVNGAAASSSNCPTGSVMQIKGTSTSGAAARESCGTASGASCTTGSQVVLCTSGTVTILNWASGNWNITVNLLASTDTTGASPLATASLTGKTVTEGQITDLGTAALTTGGGGTTSATIAFTFDTSVTQCASATLTANPADTSRCLRYKLSCPSGTSIKNNTTGTASSDKADQQAMCAASTTSAVASFTPSATGSCVLEAQLMSTASGKDCYDNISTDGHCSMYGTANVTINSGSANALTVNLTTQSGGTCPLTKQLW